MILDEIERNGVKLGLTTYSGFEIDAPDGISAQAQAAIRAHKSELLSELRRRDLTQDPRPDLVEDGALWCKLLSSAYEVDGTDPTGLAGVLHGLRCVGCRLAQEDGVVRLQAGDNEDYETDRATWLLPHAASLIGLLRTLAEEATCNVKDG